MHNKKALPFLFFSVSFILTGCGSMSANKNLSKGEVIKQTQKEAIDLTSVSEKLTLTIDNDIGNVQQKAEQQFDTVYLYNDGGNLSHIHTQQVNTSPDGNKQELGFYKTPEKAYIFDGNSWQKHNGEENYSSTYKPVLDSFIRATDELTMTEEETHYVFAFEGKNEALFDAVQPIFNIQFNGEFKDNLVSNVSFKLNKENMLLDDVLIEVENDMQDQGKSTVTGIISFYDFNETKDIKIPDDVKN